MTMTKEDAARYTERCFNGEPASCVYACPYHIDVRSFLKKAARGRWDSCYKDLTAAVVFPLAACSLCGRECEGSCQRVCTGDEPVAVRDVELACIALAKSHVPDAFSIVPKPERIAVIGAGTAGLSAAWQMARKGYAVTVFEKDTSIGGSLRTLPRAEEILDDVSSVFSVTSVEFRTGTPVTGPAEADGFAAVIIATGRGGDGFGLAEARDPSFLTSRPGWFAVGEVCGTDVCGALAEGNTVPNAVEAYLLSGSTEFASVAWDRANCTRFVDHAGAERKPLTPKTGEVYTKDEAKAEAGRCLQCDCTDCMKACEHLLKYRKTPPRFTLDVYQDSQVRPPVTSHSTTRAVYACNLCGRCSGICPEETDLPGLFCLSRENRMERGDYPPAFHDYWLRSLDRCSSESAVFLDGAPGSGYAFFPGCQLGAASPDYVIKTYELLRDRYGAGLMDCCCGAPAYWGGDRARLDRNTEMIRSRWETMGRPTLVTACASCTRMLKKVLPDIPSVSLYALLAGDSPGGRFPGNWDTVSVFDPCAVSGDPDTLSAVRTLAGGCGVQVSSYSSDGKCCGNGGHIRLADPALYGEIARNRAEDSEHPFVVYCVNCREVFLSQGKDCRHILEGLLGFDAGPTPHLDEKERNRMKVKVHLLEKYGKESFVPEEKPWDGIRLSVGEDVRAAMEAKMISDADVRECIWNAEKDGEGFYNAGEDTYLVCLVRSALTYWVRYRKNGDGFDVLDAYCHRMHFRENE
ncbi:MAG: FAD-dependent oxidoreductase [Oscillospiraceae bacterium]|nr:FAD-dependent oxidoreductase [Oscillospiraceae bacterium]